GMGATSVSRTPVVLYSKEVTVTPGFEPVASGATCAQAAVANNRAVATTLRRSFICTSFLCAKSGIHSTPTRLGRGGRPGFVRMAEIHLKIVYLNLVNACFAQIRERGEAGVTDEGDFRVAESRRERRVSGACLFMALRLTAARPPTAVRNALFSCLPGTYASA